MGIFYAHEFSLCKRAKGTIGSLCEVFRRISSSYFFGSYSLNQGLFHILELPIKLLDQDWLEHQLCGVLFTGSKQQDFEKNKEIN